MLQDAFVAIREHSTLDASEPLRRGNHSHVLTTPDAMIARFPEHPGAVAGAAALAAELNFDLLEDLGYRYPHADDPDADRKLAEITAAAFDARYPHGHPLRDEALPRLEEELAVIRHLGLSGFFILHRDLLELAREVAVEVRGPSVARSMLPPGRGRGSSVSSIALGRVGHAVLLDFGSLAFEHVPLPTSSRSSSPTRASHGETPRRVLGAQAGARRRNAVRLRHVESENRRVRAVVAALRDDDLDALGPLFREGHESLRDDFEVTTPEPIASSSSHTRAAQSRRG